MDGERSPLCATDPPYLVDYDGTNHPQSFEREQAGKDNNKHWDACVDPQTSVEFFATFLRVALAHALTETAAIYQWHASRRQALVEEGPELFGVFFASARMKLEDHIVVGRAQHPQPARGALAFNVRVLHSHRSLIDLHVVAPQQLLFHRPHQRLQPQSSLGDPVPQGALGKIDSQTRKLLLLPIQRQMINKLAQ